MRFLENSHPILDFARGAPVTFTFDGVAVAAFEGEPIAVALHASGVRTLAYSPGPRKLPRGLYCAIGNCASCMMVVDGVANVKSCIELVRDGMVVQTQHDKGSLYDTY
ncbi:MAG: (2Fe-2S)-binding protein [Clostridiales bacterium]|jgi:sarcosine oxidase subunit alpha|nr:(2Fe-2S)-binding protein [Clostridiales bacterium]